MMYDVYCVWTFVGTSVSATIDTSHQVIKVHHENRGACLPADTLFLCRKFAYLQCCAKFAFYRLPSFLVCEKVFSRKWTRSGKWGSGSVAWQFTFHKWCSHMVSLVGVIASCEPLGVSRYPPKPKPQDFAAAEMCGVFTRDRRASAAGEVVWILWVDKLGIQSCPTLVKVPKKGSVKASKISCVSCDSNPNFDLLSFISTEQVKHLNLDLQISAGMSQRVRERVVLPSGTHSLVRNSAAPGAVFLRLWEPQFSAAVVVHKTIFSIL